MSDKELLKRLYKNYIKRFMGKIFIALFFSILIAGSTASIAWLLNPAIKNIGILASLHPVLYTPKMSLELSNISSNRYLSINSIDMKNIAAGRKGNPNFTILFNNDLEKFNKLIFLINNGINRHN